ncbi:MAG: LptF/LptG family permease [Phycisphaeraceae bacterium]|nr:LptF/LptG family permease [Phycisphaeraceae bacterium]
MKTVDRYIIRQFLLNFVILLAVFVLLIVVVDVALNFDEFLKANRGRGVVIGFISTVIDYYGPMIPFLYVFFSGLIVVAAMGFTYAALARHGELNAIVSSGVSMHRIAMPIVVVGFLLNLLSIPNQEYIIPLLANKIIRSKGQVGRETVRPFEIYYAVDSHRNLLSAGAFDATKQTLEDVAILERSEEGLARRRITARQAVWDESGQRWQLYGGVGVERELDISELEADVTATPHAVEYFKTSLSPAVLLAQREAFYPRLLSIQQLHELSRNPVVDTTSIRQIMWSRFSLLVMNLLVLVMGLPFFLLREPANMLLQGVKAAVVCLGAWAAGLVMLQLGVGEMNPVMTAWLPVILYLPVSAGLLMWVKT